MVGIILAGGLGTRLHPTTIVTNKHFLPVYDKPMIYYPLSFLMSIGISKIIVLTSYRFADQYRELLGSGQQWGIELNIHVEPHETSILDSLREIEPFLTTQHYCLIFGDTLINGNTFEQVGVNYQNGNITGNSIFKYHHDNPGSYGVLAYGTSGQVVQVIEKPVNFTSTDIVPAIYFLKKETFVGMELIGRLASCKSISDVFTLCLESNDLQIFPTTDDDVFLDLGTYEDLFCGANYVRTYQREHGLLLGSPEVYSIRNGWTSPKRLLKHANQLGKSIYKDSILSFLDSVLHATNSDQEK